MESEGWSMDLGGQIRCAMDAFFLDAHRWWQAVLHGRIRSSCTPPNKMRKGVMELEYFDQNLLCEADFSSRQHFHGGRRRRRRPILLQPLRIRSASVATLVSLPARFLSFFVAAMVSERGGRWPMLAVKLGSYREVLVLLSRFESVFPAIIHDVFIIEYAWPCCKSMFWIQEILIFNGSSLLSLYKRRCMWI